MESNKNLTKAPILLTVYNRYNHFKNCVESLEKNSIAKNSPLFIAIDAPYREEDIASNKQIVDYAKSIKGFKEINLFLRSENFGVRKNLDLARAEIYSVYDTMIFSEDDNEFSPYFLSYINRGLEVYAEREDVFSISGYQYPITMPKNYSEKVYLWTGLSAWGYGCWKEKWGKVDWSLAHIDNLLNSGEEISQLNKVSQHYLFALKRMSKTKNIAGDALISYYMFKNDMRTVFPVKSYVRNCGNDGSGENCIRSNIYGSQKINLAGVDYLMPVNLLESKEVNTALWEFFSNKNRLKRRLMHYLI